MDELESGFWYTAKWSPRRYLSDRFTAFLWSYWALEAVKKRSKFLFTMYFYKNVRRQFVTVLPGFFLHKDENSGTFKTMAPTFARSFLIEDS